MPPPRHPCEPKGRRPDPAELVFLRLAFRCAGLELRHYRLGPLLRRIPASLRALRTSDLRTAGGLISRDPAKLAAAIDALVIGTTGFFRDPAVFDELRRDVLPDLCRRLGRPPTVWSAACSDGAELYAVAMLLHDAGHLDAAEQMRGSDCRESAIRAASSAVFFPQRVEEIPPDLRERYVVKIAGQYRIHPELHASIRWQVRDVLADGDLGKWDLILCRNLAIYLSASSAQVLWARLASALSPGGILVVGKAERPTVATLRRVGPCLYRKGL